MRTLLLALLLVAATPLAARWWEWYDAEVYDYCVDTHGHTYDAKTCMRKESGVVRDMMDKLRHEVRSDAVREDILRKCRAKARIDWGGFKQRAHCIDTEIAYRRLHP